jgi:hypothetical protein
LKWLVVFLAAGVLAFGSAPASLGLDDNDPTESRHLLKQIFAPHLLETKSLTILEPTYCGVEIQGMVAEAWPGLSAAMKESIPNHLRPFDLRDPAAKSATGTEVCDLYLDSGHFRIHYSTDPEHQPRGYPDLQTVRDLASYLEDAYEYHRDVSGMGVVMPDGNHGGGLDLIDCYHYKIRDGLFGWAVDAEPVESDCENSYWGIFTVTTDFGVRDFDRQLRLTSEHEYYHMLQYAHNPFQYTWIMESTARNSEFHVWPEIASAWGAWHWMAHPYYSLWDGSGFHKYAPHFWIYLEAHYGKDFMTRIWKRSCSMSANDALVEELADLGTHLDVVLPDFALWNYFTGERDDGAHYDPMYQLPAVYHQVGYWDYPIPETHLPGNQTARAAGSNYIRFFGPADDNNLHLKFNGHPDLADLRAVTVLGVSEWGHQAWPLALDAEGDAEITVSDWGLYEFVTLVVTNFWDAPSDSASLAYTYSVQEVDQASGPADSARLVSSSPNPFRDNTRVFFYTPRDGTATTIRVYDLSGRLVRTLVDEPTYNGLHQIAWDGKDGQGRMSAAGIYLLRMESGSHIHTGKVMLVR